MTFEQAKANGAVYVVGCDPGPVNSALALLRLHPEPELLEAVYVANAVFAAPGKDLPDAWCGRCYLDHGRSKCSGNPALFLSYESCGCQGRAPGAGTFETAAMGGEIRRAFRPYVHGTYMFPPSDWRYMLCGFGNARTPHIYREFGNWFGTKAAGADPLKGTKAEPGPLARLHAAGAGGNMDHMKDAVGTALALDRVRFRSGRDPEDYRRPW